MNPEHLGNPLHVRTLVVSKREAPDKRVEIFTVRLTDDSQVHIANAPPACEIHDMRRETTRERANADNCGPDLFFALWDFTDAPWQCEPD